MAKAFSEALEIATGIHSYHDHRQKDNYEKASKLIISENFLKPSEKEEKIDIEVQREKEHEHGCDPLGISAIGSQGVIFNGKAACAGRSEAYGYGIKKGNFAGHKQASLQHSEENIDGIKNAGAALHSGHKLAYLYTGAFGAEKMHILATILAG